jgi:pyruvate/2-oxoglutarate dehydrogenase complex dihydrolipoamide acyltransferase (E2) component
MAREDIYIPKLGMRMMEAELIEWLVGDGEQCETGDVLAIVETDKVQNEIQAPSSGTLRVLRQQGEVYPVGEVLGFIES